MADAGAAELEIRAGPGAWIGVRLAQLIARDLQRLGIDAWARIEPSAFGEDGALPSARLEIVTLKDDEPSAPIEAGLLLPDPRAPRIQAKGRADEIDRVARDLAIGVGSALGIREADATLALSGDERAPFLIHRTLGQAEQTLASGDFLRARMQFDRAAELWKGRVIAESLAGAWRAQALQLGNDARGTAEKMSLARSSQERAEVALRNKDLAAALAAFSSALRYTTDRAFRWSVRRRLEPGRSVLAGEHDYWLVGSERVVLRIDALSGAAREKTSAARILTRIGEDLLLLEARRLERTDAAGRRRWRLELPFAPRIDGPLDAAGGFLPIRGERRLAWIDLGVGKLGEVSSGIEVLAAGGDGAVISLDGGRNVALVRPGRKSRAWKSELAAAPSRVELARGRAIFVESGQLEILDTTNGKRRGELIALGPGARWIGGDGRYGVLTFDDGHFEIIDVLGTTRTAALRGPGTPTAATAAGQGVAVAFAGGDLLFLDRDGVLLDRALVPGGAFSLVPALGTSPGVVALSPVGVFSFGEPANPERPRDADLALRIAKLVASRGDFASAMDLAEWVARTSGGRIAEAEALRAELLAARTDSGAKIAAEAARARAEAARDPTRPVPRFSLLR
ncbi:MAG: hypothetical protein IT384_26775 [Deltaproteobacteria bacterium]|nr:hypothetical protein [Deltaproteobacteria bacterium]